MDTYNPSLKNLMLSTLLLAITLPTHASPEESTSKLLTAQFDSRKVIKIEAGDFHFVPGQPAPIHTHKAPAFGYVAKGEIIYQVEGGKPQWLREGDAFYEPAGPRILRFDNASATEEAIFIDFNLQQEGEPFIVFEKKPTQNIDRRTLPTVTLDQKEIKQVDVFVSELEPKGTKILNEEDLMLGYVAEGIIELQTTGKETQRIVAGKTFSLKDHKSATTKIINASKEVPAKVVVFHLR